MGLPVMDKLDIGPNGSCSKVKTTSIVVSTGQMQHGFGFFSSIQ